MSQKDASGVELTFGTARLRLGGTTQGGFMAR